jgi:FixJ family two-component response regulator
MIQRPIRSVITIHDQREAECYARGCITVIDDDTAVREAVVAMLELEGYATKSYPSAVSYLAVLDPNLAQFPGPHCLLLDVKMPELTGLELQKKLQELSENTPIVFMSGGSGAREAVQALKHGAVDFLIKPFAEEDLLAVISEALAKNTNEQEDQRQSKDIRSRIATLTDRETQIAHMVAAGLLNRDIADKLGIAVRTVKLHRMHMMSKLGANNVIELARIIDLTHD